MSLMTRLFGASRTSRRKSQVRLGLERLEVRETPATSGWGASMYQYAYNDSTPAAGEGRPSENLALNYTKIVYNPSTSPAADYLLKLDGVKGESSNVTSPSR